MMVKRWIFDGTDDKKRLASRLITTATVLLLIFAGSPFANINTNTANAETNPYASVGTIVVNTNNTAANFTLTGPATYTGNGTSWSQADAPEGTYSITFDPIPGYDTPPSDTQNLVSGGTITFTGLYNVSVGTITVTTNNDLATFTIAGPSGTTYSGGGTSWSQSNALLGDYTITYDSITGYDTPPSSSQTLANSGDTIVFTGTYNPSVGTIVVNTNNTAATFNITGPATYTGSGTSWSQADAPEGTYTITFDPIPGYDTPPGETQTLISKGTIAFTGEYNLSVGTITVTTDNSASTFTVTGPATYIGSGTSWIQSNAPIGLYTITYGSVAGYDTPPSSSQTIVNSGDTITFTGTYTKHIYTATLGASQDAYISAQYRTNNYGTVDMNVQSYSKTTGPQNQRIQNNRSLIKFDTSILPAGSSIISATLNIYSGAIPTAIRTYQINKTTTSWNELDVTWNTQPSVASIATSSTNTPLSAGWMSWTVTPDVQAWVNGNNNYGWEIKDINEGSTTQYTTTFHSREYSDAGLRPTLVVQYTIN